MWSCILRIVDRVGGTDKDVITRIIKARAPGNWGWIKIQLPENSVKRRRFERRPFVGKLRRPIVKSKYIVCPALPETSIFS
jgi:hypothetical protein